MQLDLTNPAPYFHTIAAPGSSSRSRKRSWTKIPDNWWKKAENHIGNGPFKVTGIEEDQQWTFAANDNYWQGRPKLDGIEYRYVDDAAVALEAYRAGDLDIVQLQSDQIPEVSRPRIVKGLRDYPQAGTQFLAMNLSQEPFNDKKVREAFAYAIDRETLCKEVRSGDCLPTLSFIPPGASRRHRDRQVRLRSRGRQAGIGRIVLWRTGQAAGDQALLQQRLRRARPSSRSGSPGRYRDILGIELTLEPMEGAALIGLAQGPEDPSRSCCIFGSWYQDYPDPQNWLSAFWTCDSSLNTVGYCNEEFDKLTKSGDTTIDPAERLGYYEKASQFWSTTCQRPSSSTPPASLWSTQRSMGTRRQRAKSNGRGASHR